MMTIDLLLKALADTLLMVGLSTLIGSVLGTFLAGVMHQYPRLGLHAGLCAIEAVPFMILLVLLLPITRWCMGTSIGPLAACIPLTIGALPMYIRACHQHFNDLSPVLSHTLTMMHASPWQSMRHVYLPEVWPKLIGTSAQLSVHLLGYATIAGVMGGGGLGDSAIQYGYQQYQSSVMWITTLILMLLVLSLQRLGNHLTQRFSKACV